MSRAILTRNIIMVVALAFEIIALITLAVPFLFAYLSKLAPSEALTFIFMFLSLFSLSVPLALAVNYANSLGLSIPVLTSMYDAVIFAIIIEVLLLLVFLFAHVSLKMNNKGKIQAKELFVGRL